jgi:hypothetical protein
VALLNQFLRVSGVQRVPVPKEFDEHKRLKTSQRSDIGVQGAQIWEHFATAIRVQSAPTIGCLEHWSQNAYRDNYERH